jgi:hypothetical protein
MFIKTRTIVILVALVTATMIVEWRLAKFQSWVEVGSAKHNYNGIFGRAVGQPYQVFIHQLRLMAESGDTNRLATVLRRADERSRDIEEVWLGGGYENNFYQKSIDEILK